MQKWRAAGVRRPRKFRGQLHLERELLVSRYAPPIRRCYVAEVGARSASGRLLLALRNLLPQLGEPRAYRRMDESTDRGGGN
jgi:hypothetical protein